MGPVKRFLNVWMVMTACLAVVVVAICDCVCCCRGAEAKIEEGTLTAKEDVQ